VSGRERKAELSFLLLWVVEKPARLLKAERGGACGVWESRQRRHKHTDTGSLTQTERETAGRLRLVQMAQSPTAGRFQL